MTVKPNPSVITSGTYHMVVGEYGHKAVENAYFLNAAGSYFVQAANGTVNAFEAYADNVLASAATRLQIVLDENAEDAPTSLRGDVDGNGSVEITDVTRLIDYILSRDDTGIDVVAADCDLSGNVTIDDLTLLIDYILSRVW